MSDELFTLWFWLCGSSLGNHFSVRVSPDTTIAELKQLIRQDVGSPDTTSIHLYKIPQESLVPLDKPETVLGGLSLSNLGHRWDGTKLANLFQPQPKENHLHLVVNVTSAPVDIHCWTRGQHTKALARLDRDDPVDAIMNAAGETWSSLKDVPTSNLALYRIDPSSDSNELDAILEKPGAGRIISWGEKVATVLHFTPFSSWTLHLVVEVPKSGKVKTIQAARAEFLRNRPPELPSVAATCAAFARWQRMDETAIHCGRPASAQPRVPAKLLHPVFGQFIKDTKDIWITSDDEKLAWEFANALSASYNYYSARRVLEKCGIHLVETEPSWYGEATDDDPSVQGHRFVVAGFGGGSYFQNMGSYLESTRWRAPEMPHSPLPYFLLGFHGTSIVISGAAWNLRPTVESLSSMSFSCSISSDMSVTLGFDWDSKIDFARHIAALRKATETLEEYYKTLQEPDPLSWTSTQLFPYMTSYVSRIDHAKKHFVYQRQLGKKLIFFGCEGPNDEDRICIKFTLAYSVDAHQACEDLGFAPRVRGVEEMPGGWKMVVMDDLSKHYKMLPERPVSESMLTHMATRLDAFHETGYVHGEIRGVHLMIHKDGTDGKLVGFDCAGKAGEAKHQSLVLGSECWKPDGVQSYGVVLAAHDKAMLAHVFASKLGRDVTGATA